MWRMLQLDSPEDFVIATGEMHSVREFLIAAFKHIGREIEWEGHGDCEVGKEKGTNVIRVKVNPKYYRPTEVEQLLGDPTKAKEKLASYRTSAAVEVAKSADPSPIQVAVASTKGGNQFSDLVKMTYEGGEIAKPVPMWITPGQPDDVITLFMGYGRTRAGKIGTGLGYNAFDVRRSDAPDHGFGGYSDVHYQVK